MGNSITVDTEATSLQDVHALPQPKEPPAPDAGWNVKAWGFRNGECEPVLITPQLSSVDPQRSFIVVLSRRRGGVAPGLPMRSAVSVTQVLNEVCSPRGLGQPFSLQYDWFGSRAKDGRGPHTQSSVYLFNGAQASVYAKAEALRRGLELERNLVEKWWLSDALMLAGRPAPFEALMEIAPQLATPRALVPVHLVNSLSGSDALPPSHRRSRSQHEDPIQGLVRLVPPLQEDQGVRQGDALKVTPSPPSDGEEVPDERVEEQRTREKLLRWYPQVSDVESFLCVSGQEPAENLEKLLQARVTHVFNTVEMLVDSRFKEHFSYWSMKMADALNEDISGIFPHAIAHIERIRKLKGGKLLVHCVQGASRSCTTILSYLLWKDGKTYQETYDYIRERRGIAKPNLAFHTRLLLWERQLRDPPAVQIFRLRPYSDESPAPLVLSIEPCGLRGTPTALDPRAGYLILRTKGTKGAWFWKGKSCPDNFFSAMKVLAPEILHYAYRNMEWPPQVLATVESGAASAVDTELESLLREAGAVDPPAPQQCYDRDYGNFPQLVKLWEAWRADQKAQSLSEGTREKARVQDLLLLHHTANMPSDSVALAQSQRDMTPRLRSERLEVVGCFRWIPNAQDDVPFEVDCSYEACGFDEDEYETFQKENETSVCVFIRLRNDRRHIDVWMGALWQPPWASPSSRSVDLNAAAARCAGETVAAFRQWLESARGPLWGKDVAWDRIEPLWCLDGLDEDRDVAFCARWIRD
eukprot:Hpha_TRINITY_DN18450_c0_g1::TRINITY_DN18450_c0_g1_i1::g.165433::m.165433